MEQKPEKEDKWRDITDEFKASVVKLELGELIKPNSFTLLEAMGAIELMDPRMDSGLVLNKIEHKVLNFEQAIRAGKVKISSLELHELIGIIDDTYACMATWLDGQSLAQSVMTNLYLHDTEKIEDRCLRVFCQGTLKLVQIMDRMVGIVFCIEEEDFVLNNEKFKLADKLNDQKVLNAFDDLCQHYEKVYNEIDKNNNPNTSNKSKQIRENFDQEAETIDKIRVEYGLSESIDKSKKPELEALITRLRFTQNLYACFLHIAKNLLKDNIITPADNCQAKTNKLIQQTANNCDQHLAACLNLIDRWRETIDLGLKPAANSDKVTQLPGDYPTIMGFDPWVNHKLLPLAYPRCLNIRNRSATVDFFKDIVIKLRKCIAISSLFVQTKSFVKPLGAIEKFSKFFQPKSCVISRSFLQIMYLSNRLISQHKEELLQSMIDYCEPVVQSLKKDEQQYKALDHFLEESAKLFSQIITMYGHNPVRQHEKFADIIVSFKNLQYSAYIVSDVHKNMMVYSWTTYYMMKFCIKYVLAGFELELYSPHEYSYIFWYLYDVLLRGENNQLTIAKRLVVATCEQTMNNDISTGKNSAKLTKTKVKKRLSKLDSMMEAFHDKNLLLNEAMSCLVHGLYKLTLNLKKQGIIRSPSEEFTVPQISFARRFEIIHGAPFVYSSYYSNSYTVTEDIRIGYIIASESFRKACILFEKCGDQQDCLAVSKANQVVSSILLSNPDTFADRQVEFCFDKHPSLPVVKI